MANPRKGKKPDKTANGDDDSAVAMDSTSEVGISERKFQTRARAISAARQTLDDCNTAHAQAHKLFQNDGGNSQALKLVQRLKKMDAAKRADFLNSVSAYAEWLDVADIKVTLNQKEMFPVSNETAPGPSAIN